MPDCKLAAAKASSKLSVSAVPAGCEVAAALPVIDQLSFPDSENTPAEDISIPETPSKVVTSTLNSSPSLVGRTEVREIEGLWACWHCWTPESIEISCEGVYGIGFQ